MSDPRFGEFNEFVIFGEINNVEEIAAGASVRDRRRLRRLYGGRRWRKMKGSANVRTPSGRIRLVELHWYEAHGIGKQEIKIKKYLSAEQ